MNEKRPVSVLIAPLDWGLGHATRCIPIINELIQQGSLVIIAAGGMQKALLKEEFPSLEFLEIPGYDLQFKKGISPKWQLIFDLRRILKKIREEKNWLEKLLENRKIDVVISDNRFGLSSNKSYSVFITHQLSIKSGLESNKSGRRWPFDVGRWIDNKIRKWNYKFIERFSRCWIPDQPGENSIAGNLSHPATLPRIALNYIGILSRFKNTEQHTFKDSVLILLSGPEPHRTEFENILFSQIATSSLPIVVVRGLPGVETGIPFIKEGIKIYNHLSAVELNRLMDQFEIIISRSGYSTIMDLVSLGKTAILVPTPGQTEQEYLALYLHQKKWMCCVPQKNFNLTDALSTFRGMQKQKPVIAKSPLQDSVKELMTKISGSS